MTAFSQHISFFLSCLEEKASWCKHETMRKLSKSHLNRVRISMLGLVFEFYFIFYFPIAVGGKKAKHHCCFPVCQKRQMTVVLISDCCQIAHCGSSIPDHCHTMPCPPRAPAPGKSEDIWQGVDRWGINFITSLKLISNSINLLPMVKNPFWILRSSEQQYGMSSVS